MLASLLSAIRKQTLASLRCLSCLSEAEGNAPHRALATWVEKQLAGFPAMMLPLRAGDSFDRAPANNAGIISGRAESRANHIGKQMPKVVEKSSSSVASLRTLRSATTLVPKMFQNGAPGPQGARGGYFPAIFGYFWAPRGALFLGPWGPIFGPYWALLVPAGVPPVQLTLVQGAVWEGMCKVCDASMQHPAHLHKMHQFLQPAIELCN